MRGLLLAGLAGVMLAGPVMADEWQGRGGERQEVREDRRDFEDARRDFQDERREYRRDVRDDYRDDRRDRERRDYRWNGARYRAPAYVQPYGEAYRSWRVGYRLPSAYYGSRYGIGDPGYYRLPPAYRGTRWVRVGSDALLISVRDGYVVRAVRGLYW